MHLQHITLPSGPDQEWGCTSRSLTSWLGDVVTCQVGTQQLHSPSTSWSRNLAQCVKSWVRAPGEELHGGLRVLPGFITPCPNKRGVWPHTRLSVSIHRSLPSIYCTPAHFSRTWGLWSGNSHQVPLLSCGHSIPGPELGNCPASWQKPTGERHEVDVDTQGIPMCLYQL